jgi:hypothetical protein
MVTCTNSTRSNAIKYYVLQDRGGFRSLDLIGYIAWSYKRGSGTSVIGSYCRTALKEKYIFFFGSIGGFVTEQVPLQGGEFRRKRPAEGVIVPSLHNQATLAFY